MKPIPVFLAMLAFPTVVRAQLSRSHPPSRPWYVSAQLASHTFEIVVPGDPPGLAGVQPYQFTIGYFFAPRWAMQAGYSAYHFFDERTAYGTTLASEPTSRYLYAEAWDKAIPLLLRRSLTRNAAHRMQFDGMVGMTIVHYRDKVKIVTKTNDQITWQNSWSDQTTNAYLTLGPAVTYRFGQHLEGCFDFLLTKNLHNINRTFSTQQLNSTLGFQRGWNLGLRYRFNVKKKPAAAP